MSETLLRPSTAFEGQRLLGSGPLREVALAVKRASEDGASGPVLTYDDATGRLIYIDIRGTDEEMLARLSGADAAPDDPRAGEMRGRGRPSLGVVAREVTLLPRHWEWLNEQPGGASVALRKLVDEARRASGDKDRTRRAQEAAYRFMSSLAGDLPGFEEALRALFADDRRRFGELIAGWPADIRDYAVRLAFSDRDQ